MRESRSHAVRWAFIVALFLTCFVGYRAFAGVTNAIDEWTQDLPSIEANEDAFNYAQESVMYAADGTTLLANFQLEKRDPVTEDAISPFVLQATVATEDVRFYEHNGVDLTGIARAVFNNLLGQPLEGASTITQQLMRNTILSEEATDITIERKVREAQLAIDFEKTHSKDEILTMYLNTINYGDGCYGIEAAAQNYFQVSAKDLTLAQAAALVGIPQSPTYYNPKVNPDACLTRRNTVLQRMVDAGYITEQQRADASIEPLNLNPAPDEPYAGIHAYPYFTSYVRDQLLAQDNVYGCSYAQLFEGGLTIYTTLDPAIQDCADEACAEQADALGDDLEAALVAMDPKTGYVKAVVGGRDFYTDEWNIATQGGRPTGSSFKAFTLAAAIEQGISPQTLIDCTNPLTTSTGTQIYNFDRINYGIRSIQSATAVSSNTGYYRLAEALGARTVAEMANRLGVTTSLPNYPIITLGTENVTPLDMATAYSTLASGGVKHEPVVITKILDRDGNVIYQADTTGEQVLSPEVAGATTKVLRTVFESSQGTAYGMGPSNGQVVAGKTGTGMEFRDHWLVGYCPQLTCAAWVGNRDYSSTSPYITAEPLWHNFMSAALQGTELESFPTTADPPYTNAFNQSQSGKYGNSSSSSAPNVVGQSFANAQSALNAYYYSYTYVPSSSYPAGTIISQTTQSDGSIALTISSGPNGTDFSTGSTDSSSTDSSSSSSTSNSTSNSTGNTG